MPDNVGRSHYDLGVIGGCKIALLGEHVPGLGHLLQSFLVARLGQHLRQIAALVGIGAHLA
jgi:hypothetical protein